MSESNSDRRALGKVFALIAAVVMVGLLIQFGFRAELVPCRYCEESGSVIVAPCQACQGAKKMTVWQWAKAGVIGFPRR